MPAVGVLVEDLRGREGAGRELNRDGRGERPRGARREGSRGRRRGDRRGHGRRRPRGDAGDLHLEARSGAETTPAATACGAETNARVVGDQARNARQLSVSVAPSRSPAHQVLCPLAPHAPMPGSAASWPPESRIAAASRSSTAPVWRVKSFASERLRVPRGPGEAEAVARPAGARAVVAERVDLGRDELLHQVDGRRASTRTRSPTATPRWRARFPRSRRTRSPCRRRRRRRAASRSECRR